MDPVAQRLNKLREERLAREKARIEKLRELNLKKYNKNEEQSKMVKPSKSVDNKIDVLKPQRSNSVIANAENKQQFAVKTTEQVKNLKFQLSKVNDKRSESKTTNMVISQRSTVSFANIQKTQNATASKSDNATNLKNQPTKIPDRKSVSSTTNVNKSKITGPVANGRQKQHFAIRKTDANVTLRKSFAVKNDKPKPNERKSMIPRAPSSTSTSSGPNCSVFERLYKPKQPQNSHLTDVEKLRTDPNHLKKVIQTSNLILNKRQTVFEQPKAKIVAPVRRSISAVHFKRIDKQELGNCIHKWASIGDKLNKAHVRNINEDENVKSTPDRVISAVKSERKRVTFMTPVPNLNTPRPEELQSRLKAWLLKRGKSLDSYHHLQCFGIHHLPHSLKFDSKPFDEENKENIALESDSDDDSFHENMNEEPAPSDDKWRTASVVSDSVDFNETQNSTATCSDVVNVNLDEVVIGALNDLTELLKEGFDWEQCARWLRAIRERFPSAPHSAAYWECRAALEERRGDLPASVQCWEEAIAKGTEHSVVEANLDQLLDKFMQLKISPNSGKKRPADPKLVDVKNVFKSTIIRFAVQQAKIRQSNQFEAPKYTVTPVRRSARISSHWSGKRTPLQVCTSVRQADEVLGEKPVFVPNVSLYGTP